MFVERVPRGVVQLPTVAPGGVLDERLRPGEARQFAADRVGADRADEGEQVGLGAGHGGGANRRVGAVLVEIDRGLDDTGAEIRPAQRAVETGQKGHDEVVVVAEQALLREAVSRLTEDPDPWRRVEFEVFAEL